MRAPRRVTVVLGIIAMTAAGAATVGSVAGSSGSLPIPVLLAASSGLLAAALAVSGRSPMLSAVSGLAALGAVILAVTATKVLTGSSPGALSVLGALLAFLIAPGVCAYDLRSWRGFRPAVLASVAVPLIFLASIVLDGPILQGAGATIDAIDAAIVPPWLLIVAANLVIAGGA